MGKAGSDLAGSRRNPPTCLSEPMAHRLKHLTLYEGRRRFSVLHLLICIVVMFVISPFVDKLTYGHFIESIVFSLLMIAAVSAVGGRRRSLIAAGVLVLPVLTTRWINHFWPNFIPLDLTIVVAIVFVSFVIAHLFRFVITAPQVTSEVLCAAISIYLLFAVVWAFAYTLLAHWQPGAFEFTNPKDADAKMTGFAALYFAVQILTTITFGDIVPITNIARMMALVQSTSGVFYMATMVARLVGLYTGKNASRTT